MFMLSVLVSALRHSWSRLDEKVPDGSREALPSSRKLGSRLLEIVYVLLRPVI
jgi:hypothetical protein